MAFFFRRRRKANGPTVLSRLDQEVREEIRFHIEMRVGELEAEGLEPEEALRQALEAFGDPEEVVEETRQENGRGSRQGRGMELMSSVIQDLVFAVRTLRKRPMFTVAALISLGLGIGANTAIFSIMNALLVRPLSVAEADRLIPVYTSQTGGARHGNTSYPDYLDYKERNEVFQGLAAYMLAPMAIGGEGAPRVAVGQLVSWDYFSVLGVEPALGRSFLPEEDEAFGAHPVVVLSHGTWQDLFDADPGILGRTVRINDSPFEVIGVAPAGFTGLTPIVEPALWAPLTMVGQAIPFSPNVQSRIDPWLQLVGRLREGVSATDAAAGLDVLAMNLATEFPVTNRNKGIVTGELNASRLLSPETTEGAGKILGVLLAVVGFVLLVACFNVANLQLAKAVARRREIALRFSLGASRFRIVRQLLVESLLLALLAGGVGLVLAVAGLDAMQMIQPQMEMPLQIPISLDLRVLGFTLFLALSTGMVFGLAPVLQVLRPGQSDALKDQGSTSGPSRSSTRVQSALVVGQVALSLVLLASAGLFMKSLKNTLAIDPGFDLPNGVVVPMNLGYGQYTEAEGRELHQRLLDRVRAMPEVETAALTAFAPLGFTHGHHDVDVEGYDAAPEELMLVKRNMVSPDYFAAMGIQVLRGRAIDERDTEEADPVAMVNEHMARRFWPGQDPIGRFIRADLGITYTVVGIVEDGKYGSLQEIPESYLVLPLTQSEHVERMNLVVRTTGDASVLARRLTAEIREIAPGLPPSTAMTSRQYLDYSSGNAKMPALMIGAFGVLALLLATVGLYGVMWYTVTQRIREFGVRLALGASEKAVVRMVMGKGLVTTLVGVFLGFILALAGTQFLSGLLYGVGALDPIVFSLVPVILVGVGLLASYLPARHASKADPVVVLRAE
jgi:macrolide transport system ATP-binding/permease protein